MIKTNHFKFLTGKLFENFVNKVGYQNIVKIMPILTTEENDTSYVIFYESAEEE